MNDQNHMHGSDDVCEVEGCGMPATCSRKGFVMCEGCAEAGEEILDSTPPPHWADEVPTGLLLGDEDDGEE